jgi:hypothetical protein
MVEYVAGRYETFEKVFKANLLALGKVSGRHVSRI